MVSCALQSKVILYQGSQTKTRKGERAEAGFVPFCAVKLQKSDRTSATARRMIRMFVQMTLDDQPQTRARLHSCLLCKIKLP